MLSPPSSKKLSSMPTRASPSTSANSPHRISSCGVRGARCDAPSAKLRRRQRAPVELAVRRQRQPIQHHQRRRHHVVRQHLRTAPHEAPTASTAAKPPAPPPQLPPPHSRPAAGPTRPVRRAPPQPPATPPPAAAAQPRSRQARSGTRAASPARRPAPETPAPRPPRHRARSPVRYIRLARQPMQRAMRVGHKPLRRQTRTLPDSPAQAQHPRCKARPQPPTAQAPNNRPNINPIIPEADDQSGRAQQPSSRTQRCAGRTKRCFRRSISIDHRDSVEIQRCRSHQVWRTRFAGENQLSAIAKHVLRSMLDQQHRYNDGTASKQFTFDAAQIAAKIAASITITSLTTAQAYRRSIKRRRCSSNRTDQSNRRKQ